LYLTFYLTVDLSKVFQLSCSLSLHVIFHSSVQYSPQHNTSVILRYVTLYHVKNGALYCSVTVSGPL
jgi:hypothetical protein